MVDILYFIKYKTNLRSYFEGIYLLEGHVI